MTLKEIKTGQDSFLDIIANLVGILIILVVVVGAQAKKNWIKTEPNSADIAHVEELKTNLEDANAIVNKLTVDNRLLEEQIDREVQLGTQLAKKRHRMLVALEIIKQKIGQKKEQLDEQRQVQFDKNVKKASLETQLAEIQTEIQAVSTVASPTTETIEHYPTPIAKTVFSDEVHFRLAAGKLSYVPMDELSDLMKTEWRVKAEKLKQSPSTLETIGPIAGFRMQYELEAVTVTRPTEFGESVQQIVRLNRFVLFPVFEGAGETVPQALQENSEFRQKIERQAASKTTVSVWVYPDSFSQFNELKKWLRSEGYQTACWPLSEGSLISGGPNGFRTSAQ